MSSHLRKHSRDESGESLESDSDTSSDYELSNTDSTIERPRKCPRLNRKSISPKHLPCECLEDFRFVFRPAIRELAGTLRPWDSPSDREVIQIWNQCFPAHQLDKHGRNPLCEIIFKLVHDTIRYWRRDIATAAVGNLDVLLKTMFNKKADRMAHASWLLGDENEDRKRPYYYRQYEANAQPAGIFQSHIVAATLATHLKSIPPPPKDSQWVYPTGALALSLLAINRALTWAKSGVSSIPKTPPGHFSKSNWGDQFKLKGGKYVVVKTSSNVVQVIRRLKDTQWSRIIAIANTYVPYSQSSEDEAVEGGSGVDSDFKLDDADEDP